MSREVCGICWCPYDEETGECARAPEPKTMTCPSCEYNKQRAQLWRNEAYKHAGHPLDWEPELMVRPKPLSEEEALEIARTFGAQPWPPGSCVAFARAVERAHRIGGEA